MPTYDFKCDKCGKKFSEFVSIREKENVRCPDCGGKPSQLLTGFVFKPNSDDYVINSGNCSGGSCSSCSGC